VTQNAEYRLHPEGKFPATIIDWIEPRESKAEVHIGTVFSSLCGPPDTMTVIWRNRYVIKKDVSVHVWHKIHNGNTYTSSHVIWEES
jgi:hypothetical protein